MCSRPGSKVASGIIYQRACLSAHTDDAKDNVSQDHVQQRVPSKRYVGATQPESPCVKGVGRCWNCGCDKEIRGVPPHSLSAHEKFLAVNTKSPA